MRLTLGALAEMAETLNVKGPMELSHKMKRLKPDVAVRLLRALLRPVHGHNITTIDAVNMSPDIVVKMAKLFERAFANQNNKERR